MATEGWGARLLALQGEDGQWAGGACFPAQSFNWRTENQGQPWISTLPTLQLLYDFGIDPCCDRVRRAVALSQRTLPLGARRTAVLQRRGRALHQWQDRHIGHLLWSGCGWRGRPPTW